MFQARNLSKASTIKMGDENRCKNLLWRLHFSCCRKTSFATGGNYFSYRDKVRSYCAEERLVNVMVFLSLLCLLFFIIIESKSLALNIITVMQQGDADDLIKAVHAEIQKTPEKGHQFSASIKRVMQSEDQWADWKANGAQSFDRQPQVVVAIERPTKKRKLAHWKHTDAG